MLFILEWGKEELLNQGCIKHVRLLWIMIHLELQPKGIKVGIKILSEQKYRIELNGNLNFEKEMNFGERFSEYGFNFTIELRDPENFVFDERTSNKYYFYFTDPESLANQYRGKLSVAPIEKDASLVTSISFWFCS